MMIRDLTELFLAGIKQTSWLEYAAVVAGIASVWFSKKENILVYPVGLVNTVIYVYLSFKYHLIGEAGVNFYYTIMSVYGWILWSKKDVHQHQLPISFSTPKELRQQLAFFFILYALLYFLLSYLKKHFYEGAIPWADGLASATAFTGMYLMAKKKVESWWWWIATNLASVPLYFVKGLVVTSLYYLVLLLLAIFGLREWRQRAGNTHQ